MACEACDKKRKKRFVGPWSRAKANATRHRRPQPFRPRHFLERFLAPPAACSSGQGLDQRSQVATQTRESVCFLVVLVLQLLKNPLGESRANATAAISAKTFFGAIFGSACGVQLWAGARPAKPGCHPNPGIGVFSRGPGPRVCI
jgi:hypothetical protein